MAFPFFFAAEVPVSSDIARPSHCSESPRSVGPQRLCAQPRGLNALRAGRRAHWNTLSAILAAACVGFLFVAAPAPAAVAHHPAHKVAKAPAPSVASVIAHAKGLIAKQQYDKAEAILLDERATAPLASAKLIDLELSDLYLKWAADLDSRKNGAQALAELVKGAAVDARIDPKKGAADNVAIGDRNLANGDARAALTSYAAAADLSKSVSDNTNAAESLRKVGNCEVIEGATDKAVQSYNQALTLYLAAGDSAGMAHLWSSLTLAYVNGRQYAKAVDAAQTGKDLYKTISDTRGEPDLYYNCGIAEYNLGHYAKSLDAFNAALPLYRAVSDDKNATGDTLAWIGQVEAALKDNVKGAQSYGDAAALFQQTDNRIGLVRALSGQGDALSANGDYAGAIAAYKQLLPIYHAAARKDDEARIDCVIALAYVRSRDYNSAAGSYAKALTLYQELANNDGIARAYTGIGIANEMAENYPAALDAYSKSLPIYENAGDKADSAVILLNIGVAFDQQSAYSQALKYYNQALSLFNQLHDKDQAAQCQAKINMVLSEMVPGG